MGDTEYNKIFIEEEIKQLTDFNIQHFLRSCADKFPDYFWKAPASAYKHHYPDERESGGLVLHTRRLCKLTREMVRKEGLNMWEQDILLASCILHDSFARGIPPQVSTRSDPLHPLYVPMQFPYKGFADTWLDEKVYDEIMLCIVSHSGKYSVTKVLNVDKKLPNLFKFIDYFGSRTYIKVEL